MSMIIFISHKKEDSEYAQLICNELKSLGVRAYLDVLEGELLLEGEKLTKHIRSKLNSCTDLLAVMSDKTKDSWWVPFEIGMAAQQDFPIVSYLINNIDLPDYLSYWPKLREITDLSKYVNAKNSIVIENIMLNKSFDFSTRTSETNEFYERLKKVL